MSVPKTSFSLVQTTTTSAVGFYYFTRAEGVVTTNRSWFVTGPDGTHSRTISEGVAALVTLSSNRTTAVTGQRIVFTGNVSPSHSFQRVKLEEQNGLLGNVWTTLASTYTDGSSNFDFSHSWARPGDYTLRAVFPGDARNLEGDSDSLTVTVQQRQHALFTINSSDPIITAGQSVTISGTLYSSASVPEPSTSVGLYGGTPGDPLKLLTTTMTGSNGGYSFTRSPIHNKVFFVATTLEASPADREPVSGRAGRLDDQHKLNFERAGWQRHDQWGRYSESHRSRDLPTDPRHRTASGTAWPRV